MKRLAFLTAAVGLALAFSLVNPVAPSLEAAAAAGGFRWAAVLDDDFGGNGKVKDTQPETITVQGDVILVVLKLPFKVVSPRQADDYVWRVPSSWRYEEEDGGAIVVSYAPEGSYAVGLRTLVIDFDKKKLVRKTYAINLSIGKAPVPPDPGPPGPDPPVPPDPPDPPPPPEPPDPFGTGGNPRGRGSAKAGVGVGPLRVLMLYDSAKKTGYTKDQLNILEGSKVRDYLETRCADDPRVKGWKAYRIWPADVDASAEDQVWQKALRRPRQSLPWVLIGNGRTGYEGPLPANPDAAVSLLRKYGGA